MLVIVIHVNIWEGLLMFCQLHYREVMLNKITVVFRYWNGARGSC